MIYITGDTHGSLSIAKLNDRNFPQQQYLSKNDYVIICGDFGLVWNNSEEELKWRKWLSNRTFTTLFIDGNHENFDLLYDYPIIEKFGGKVHQINDSIYHLCRGQVFNIDNKTFLTMGGARSVDKAFRQEYVSWWKQEVPNYDEYEEILYNVEKSHREVDYVLTHTAPLHILKLINKDYELDGLTIFLWHLAENLKFKKWFFGHYHQDFQIENYYCVFNKIIPITNGDS